MDADPDFDPLFAAETRVALDHPLLHFDRAADSVDRAAKLGKKTVSRALEDTALADVDGGLDEVATQRPKPRQSAFFVDTREPAEANHVGDQDRDDLPGLVHPAPPARPRLQGGRPSVDGDFTLGARVRNRTSPPARAGAWPNNSPCSSAGACRPSRRRSRSRARLRSPFLRRRRRRSRRPRDRY